MEMMRLEGGGGATHTCWNDSGEKMAAGLDDGSIRVYEPEGGSHSGYSRTAEWQAHQGAVVKLVWGPSEYGDLLACCSTDGAMSVWEEIQERDREVEWRLCLQIPDTGVPVLDVQFRNFSTGLKLVAAGANGHLKVYEAANALDLSDWQLQAEFSNVTDVRDRLEKITCNAASICWKPPTDVTQHPVFVAAFRTNSSQHGVAKIWEFGETHQRWHLVAELTDPGFDYGLVNHVSWAPNIGRPYELISVASSNSLSIWSLHSQGASGLRSAVELLGYFTEHQGEVWQVEWDVTGMTLASSGGDGVVRLWQSNYKGQWEQRGILEGTRDLSV